MALILLEFRPGPGIGSAGGRSQEMRRPPLQFHGGILIISTPRRWVLAIRWPISDLFPRSPCCRAADSIKPRS